MRVTRTMIMLVLTGLVIVVFRIAAVRIFAQMPDGALGIMLMRIVIMIVLYLASAHR